MASSKRTQRQRAAVYHDADYPADWPEITKRIKDRAGWCCERCRHPHDPPNGYTLTTHHLDMNKANCEDWNLAALCQRCHLHIQGKVDFAQPYMFEHSAWMKPHVEGYQAAMAAGRPA